MCARFMMWRTCSSVSVEVHDTSCCTEISCETFRLAPAAPCSAMARTTSRSVNMPTAVLPSVRTTSLTTSALILLARINWVAMATVSFIRTVATRAVFLRRMSPTFIATSFRLAAGRLLQGLTWYTLCQLSILILRKSQTSGSQKAAVILTFCGDLPRCDQGGAACEDPHRLEVYQRLEKSPRKKSAHPRGMGAFQ